MLQSLFQVGTGHHHVAHQLETARFEMHGSLEAEVRIVRIQLGQRHQSIGASAREERILLCQQTHIDSCLTTQTHRIQSLRLQHSHQHPDVTGTDPVHSIPLRPFPAERQTIDRREIRILEARKAFFLIQIKTRPNHCQNATELARKDNPASPRNIVPAREAPEA